MTNPDANEPLPTAEQRAWELIHTLARMTTPYDGIDKNDGEAVDRAEDLIDGDQERDDASTLWELIDTAREIAEAKRTEWA